MTLQGLLPEFDQEMAVTRRLIERAPAAAFDWRPHPRSFTLGGLTTHLSRLPQWGARILTRPGHDLFDASTIRALIGSNREPRAKRFILADLRHGPHGQ